MRAVGVVVVLAVATWAIPTEKLTLDSVNDMVGMTRFEAKLMSLARMGKYELFFNVQDIYNIIADSHPFHTYEEAKENVVLLDEFPYVPVVEVPTFNSSFVLSNLILHEHFDPRMLKVELNVGFQSLKFLDIQLNATFDWRINGTEQTGRAIVHIPHAWVHQNLEVGCARDQASVLSWEGRVDLGIDGIEFATTLTNQALMAEFAEQLHSSMILKKYIGNAMQHQLASFMGDIHWKVQSRMRDLCLMCVVVKNNNATMVAQVRGDKACLNAIPSFFWKGIYDETETPAAVQAVAPEAIREAMKQEFRPRNQDAANELLGEQDLTALNTATSATPRQFDKLTPRIDPREKFRVKKHDGFVEDQAQATGWRAKLGAMWMKFRYGKETNATVAT